MKLTFEVKVLAFKEIHELPDSWKEEDFKEILQQADFDDWDQIDPGELKDYTIMALQELEADEAAELVLNYKLGNKLTKGQIQNLAHEMLDEKLWEEYTDINLHKELFDCSVLVKWTFPRILPETDAIKCVIEVSSNNREYLTNINKITLTRLLAKGMDDHAVVNRLFEDQVNGAAFPEAEGIIWQFEISEAADNVSITIYSSNYWLHSMDEVDHFTAEVFSSN